MRRLFLLEEMPGIVLDYGIFLKKVRFREGILLTQGENSAKIQIDMTYDVLKQKRETL